MIGRLRVVLPPTWTIGFFVSLLALLEVWHWVLRGFHVSPTGVDEFRLSALIAGSFAFGVFRAVAFQPAQRPGYHAWLFSTPWTADRPLPLGPVHLVWQDAFCMSLVTALAYYDCRSWRAAAPLIAFLAAYLISHAFVICQHQRPIGYAVVLCLGLALRFALAPLAFLASIALAYGLVYVGLRRITLQLPHQPPALKTARATLPKRDDDIRKVGWPMTYLSPHAAGGPFSLWDRWALSLHAGFWSSLCFWLVTLPFEMVEVPVDAHIEQAALRGFRVALLLGAGIRLWFYCSSHWPPISLSGRLLTFRWIIPGYDKVFVAPLLAIVVGEVSARGLLAVGLKFDVSIGIAAFLAAAVLLHGGPTLRDWRLTGEHRGATVWLRMYNELARA